LRAHKYASLVKRIGTVLVAIGLAFATAGVLAQASLNSGPPPGEFVSSNLLTAHSYDIVCCSPPFVSPRQVVYLSAIPTNVSASVYVMKTNDATFQSSVSGVSPPNSFSGFGYGEGNSSAFLNYLSSHGGQLIAEYNVSARGHLQTDLVPKDVEPLMVVLLNAGDSNTSVSYAVYQNSITIAPALGFAAAAGLIVAGGVVFATGYVLARPEKKT